MSLPLIIVSTHQLRNVLLFTASARRSQSMTPLPVVKSLPIILTSHLICKNKMHTILWVLEEIDKKWKLFLVN